MTARHLTIAAVLALLACSDSMTEPEAPHIEVWTGIATPVVTSLDGAAADLADTLWVQVIQQRDEQSQTVFATFAIWEADPDPCTIWWLPDREYSCYFMTKGTGFGVPFADPDGRALDFTFPVLGECELAGPVGRYEGIAYDEWRPFLRCGDFRRVVYSLRLNDENGSGYIPLSS